MKTVLPILWYSLGGLLLVIPLLLPAMMGTPETQTTALAISLPQAVLALASSIAVGLVYALIFRTRPSVAAMALGILHLIAALISHGGRLMGNTVQQEMMSGTVDMAEISQRLAVLYGASTLMSLLGWVLFIVALIIALNTKPPAETAF